MWYNIWAIFIKEVIHIRRDPFTLGMMFFIPIFQLTIFGYAVNMDVRHLKTAVFNQDHLSQSRQLVADFINTKYFDVTQYVDSEQALIDMILKGDARVGINIPPDYSASLIGKRETQVQVLIDGSDSTVANQAMNVARAIGQNRSIETVQSRLSEVVGAKIEFSEPIDIRPRVLFNPDLRSANFMIPGLLGTIMQLVTIMLTSFAIVRERERGTFEQLIVTPIKPYELMMGKLLPYFIIGITNMCVVVAVMVLLFRVPIAGSLLLLFSLSVFFIITSLSIGLLISTVASNQVQAVQMTFFVYLPSIMLSGFIFPRESMPLLLNWMGLLVPLTYFLEVLRGIILRGVGMEALWRHVWPIIYFGVFFILISVLRFRKKVV